MKRKMYLSHTGFTLLETMIALGIFVLVLLVMAGTLIYINKESHNFTEKVFGEVEKRLVERVLFRDLKDSSPSFNILKQDSFFDYGPGKKGVFPQTLILAPPDPGKMTIQDMFFIVSKNKKLLYTPLDAYSISTDHKSFEFKSLNYKNILFDKKYTSLGSKEIWKTNNLVMLENPYFESNEGHYSYYFGFVQDQDKNDDYLFPLTQLIQDNNCLSDYESFFSQIPLQETSKSKYKGEDLFLQKLYSNSAPDDIRTSMSIVEIVKYSFKESKIKGKWELYRSILNFHSKKDPDSKKCSFEPDFFLCDDCGKIEFTRNSSDDMTIKFNITPN